MIRDGETIGGGAFKAFDARTAEFKRIWTRSDLRRQGLARKLLVELEEQAARQGYSRIYLTTGFRQPEAVGLYLNNGYTALFDTSADPEIYKTLPFERRSAICALRWGAALIIASRTVNKSPTREFHHRAEGQGTTRWQ